MTEERQEFREEVAKNAEQFTELMENISTADTEIEKNWAGAKIMKG